MNGNLRPLRFTSANEDNGRVFSGFDAGPNMAGLDVWVDAPTLLEIVRYDVEMGGLLSDWAPTLAGLDAEGAHIETESGETLWLLTDCCFMDVNEGLTVNT